MLSRFNHVQVFVTLWTVAHQAPLSKGFFQARTLEWVAMPSSRGSSRPKDRTLSLDVPCIAGPLFSRGSQKASVALEFLLQEPKHPQPVSLPLHPRRLLLLNFCLRLVSLQLFLPIRNPTTHIPKYALKPQPLSLSAWLPTEDSRPDSMSDTCSPRLCLLCFWSSSVFFNAIMLS